MAEQEKTLFVVDADNPEDMNKSMHRDRCPECGGTSFIYDYDTGETVCGDCGLVVQNVMIDRGPEWRAFTLEERKSKRRVGVPTVFSISDKGLSTKIKIEPDFYGRRISPKILPQMQRIRRWQMRSCVASSVDRNLIQAMREIHRISDTIFLPRSVKEKAAVIYRKALGKKLVQGRSIAAVSAASVYAACRATGTPRTLKEISEASLVEKGDVARCYRFLLRELDIKVPVADPLAYLSKIAEKTDISGYTQSLAAEILQEAKRRHVSAGKDPMGLAAAALYVACRQNNEHKTQNAIAQAANITEVTIRNRYKMLMEVLGLN